jgi:hypothetical protein
MTSVATRLVSISPMFISTGLIEELIIQRLMTVDMMKKANDRTSIHCDM